jgi:hypothetical protein
MSPTPIAPNVHQSLDVHGFPTAQIPFNLILIDRTPQGGHIGFTQIFDASVWIHASCC